MVLQLRSGLATHNNEQQREFLDDIIRWMYLQVDLNDTLQTYLYRYIEPPKDNISTYLQLAQSVLHNDRRFNKMSFTLRSDDALLHGNLPSVYATLPTKVIRCGKPVIDAPLWFTPKISPEFRRFVQLQPRHLYVNLMKRHGSEGPGTQALEHLEKEISEFSVITLDKNSDFYQQRGLDPQKKQASDLFKMKFLENMTREKGNYYWSENLDRNDWTKELAHILDEVHVRHFSSKEELDVEERLDFIELTYVAIIDRLLERLRPASMNISCRHGMDRGPSLLVLWLLQKGQLDDQALAALLLTPPLIIHNRSSHAHRISRFVSASKRML